MRAVCCCTVLLAAALKEEAGLGNSAAALTLARLSTESGVPATESLDVKRASCANQHPGTS